MLITLTIESHLATLPGVEDESIVSTVVFCGVCEGSNMLQFAVNKYVAGVVQWQNVSFTIDSQPTS